MTYQLEGQMLEVCTCDAICPCFSGRDPDGGVCEGILAFDIERGSVGDVDVAGRKVVMVAHLPGNALQGGWKLALLVDDQANEAQQNALIQVWTGKLGGPVGDLAQLYGEVVAVEKAAIDFNATEGTGSIHIKQDADAIAEAEFAGLKGPTGRPTTLVDPLLGSIPGSPFYAATASTYRRYATRYGMADVDISDHNAIHGAFRYEA